jgi:hypothetical protein
MHQIVLQSKNRLYIFGRIFQTDYGQLSNQKSAKCRIKIQPSIELNFV